MLAVGLDYLVVYVIELGVPPGYWFWSVSNPWYRYIQYCIEYGMDIVSYVKGLCSTTELAEVNSQVDDMVLEQLPISFLPGSVVGYT
jgi:hypothetical protein